MVDQEPAGGLSRVMGKRPNITGQGTKSLVKNGGSGEVNRAACVYGVL